MDSFARRWLARYVILIASSIAILVFLASVARGSPLDCEGISNADQRNLCRAVTKHQKSYCEVIKDRDLRFRCRAEVK